MLSLDEIGPLGLENNISKSCQSVFTIWLSSHFGKGHGPQFEFLSSKDARFGWNWPSSSGEEANNVKIYTQTLTKTDSDPDDLKKRKGYHQKFIEKVVGILYLTLSKGTGIYGNNSTKLHLRMLCTMFHGDCSYIKFISVSLAF